MNIILAKNQQLLLLLGYASALIFQCEPYIEKNKYDWILEAISNVVYLDKPMPPMP